MQPTSKLVILSPIQEAFLTELFALCQRYRHIAEVEIFSTGLHHENLCLSVFVHVPPACPIDRCDLDLAYIAEE